MIEIVDRAEEHTRARIAEFPDGVYHARDCLDGDGIVSDPRWVDVRITISGSDLTVDLTASDLQSTGGMNCSRSAAISAVQFAIKAVTDPENPPNAGSYRPIRVETKSGTLCDAEQPASMIGFGEVTYRVMDATLAALAPALGRKAVASGSGSTGTVCVTGRMRRPNGDRYFTTLELSSGAHADQEQGPVGHRAVFVATSGAVENVPVYKRASLAIGQRITGPAIIEERESTTILGTADVATVDRWACLQIDVELPRTFALERGRAKASV